MEVGVFVQNQRLKDALYAYMDKTKKTLAQAVNRTAKDIAMHAMSRDYTKEASEVAIEQIGKREEVDVVKAIRITSGIGGAKRIRVKTGSKWKSSPDRGTFKLANWIMKNQGLPPLGNTKQGIPAGALAGKSKPRDRLEQLEGLLEILLPQGNFQ